MTEELNWYEEEWLNNLFHGRGILNNLYAEDLDREKYYADDFTKVENGWEMYEGEFKSGQKHGMGSLHLVNGDSYVGGFQNNKVEYETGHYALKLLVVFIMYNLIQ